MRLPHATVALALALSVPALATASPDAPPPPVDDDALVSKAGPAPNAQNLINVYRVIKGLQPGSKAAPSCGVFLQTGRPGPQDGMLLHVTSKTKADPLLFTAESATNPAGLIKHKVGHLVPKDLKAVLDEAEKLPPATRKESNIGALRGKNCAQWPKRLVQELQAKGLLQKTAGQKAGEKAWMYYAPATSVAFAAMYAAPLLANFKKGQQTPGAAGAHQQQPLNPQWYHNYQKPATPGFPVPGSEKPGLEKPAPEKTGSEKPTMGWPLSWGKGKAGHEETEPLLAKPAPGEPVHQMHLNRGGATNLRRRELDGSAGVGGRRRLAARRATQEESARRLGRRGDDERNDEHIYNEDLLGDGEFAGGGAGAGAEEHDGGDDGSHGE